MQVYLLEQIYELAIAPRDFGDSLLARGFFASPGNKGSQKVVRPTAKPMKPGTLAATASQFRTF
jgi:hypothetical protein